MTHVNCTLTNYIYDYNKGVYEINESARRNLAKRHCQINPNLIVPNETVAGTHQVFWPENTLNCSGVGVHDETLIDTSTSSSITSTPSATQVIVNTQPSTQIQVYGTLESNIQLPNQSNAMTSAQAFESDHLNSQWIEANQHESTASNKQSSLGNFDEMILSEMIDSAIERPAHSTEQDIDIDALLNNISGAWNDDLE